MKKTLVIYYSRTKTTAKLADYIAKKIGATSEEIKDTVDRSGAVGYLLAGKDATLRKLTALDKTVNNILDYDLVIIGTPIWSWNMSTPIRTYLEEHKNEFREVAFFCTMGGSGDERAFKEMGEIIDKKPVATLALKTVEVVKSVTMEKTDQFCEKIKAL